MLSVSIYSVVRVTRRPRHHVQISRAIIHVTRRSRRTFWYLRLAEISQVTSHVTAGRKKEKRSSFRPCRHFSFRRSGFLFFPSFFSAFCLSCSVHLAYFIAWNLLPHSRFGSRHNADSRYILTAKKQLWWYNCQCLSSAAIGFASWLRKPSYTIL